MKKLLLGNLARFRVVGYKDDLDILIFFSQKLIKEEKEASRQIFLHRVHGA
jgi:hypothetical protein